MHVLCVDDDRINGLLLEHILLQIDGVTVTCADSGSEALTLAMGRRPDLMIVDLHLPDTDGLSLLPRLRRALADPEVPAILCTAEVLADVAPQARTAGYCQAWSKPVALAQVREALSELKAE